MKRPMNPCTRKILALLNCGEDEAHLVESVMRNRFGTLDDLSKSQLKRAALTAKKALDTDHELRDMVRQEVLPTAEEIAAR